MVTLIGWVVMVIALVFFVVGLFTEKMKTRYVVLAMLLIISALLFLSSLPPTPRSPGQIAEAIETSVGRPVGVTPFPSEGSVLTVLDAAWDRVSELGSCRIVVQDQDGRLYSALDSNSQSPSLCLRKGEKVRLKLVHWFRDETKQANIVLIATRAVSATPAPVPFAGN